MKKILIPVDSSEYSKRAVEQGIEMAKAFDSDVVLLYVVAIRIAAYRFNAVITQNPKFDPILDQEEKGAEQLLQEYKESFGAMKDKVEIVITHGIVADEIIEYIDSKDVDLVIMGSHGVSSALHRSILGSVTNKVVHNASKPVLVVK